MLCDDLMTDSLHRLPARLGAIPGGSAPPRRREMARGLALRDLEKGNPRMKQDNRA